MTGTNSWFSWAFHVTAGAIILVGCGAPRPTGDSTSVELRQSALTTTTYSLPLFVGQNPTDVSVAARVTLSLNDRSKVIESGSGDAAMISNLGVGVLDTSVGTTLGVSTRSGTILSRPLVFLRQSASVVGSLYQGNTRQPLKQGSTTVSSYEQTGVGFQTDTSWTRTVILPPLFNTTPNLEPGQSPPVVSLVPGRYHTVDVKAGRTLRLQAGEYFFDGLIVETGAGLQIDGSLGPVFAYVLDGGFTFRGDMVNGTNSPRMNFPSFTVMTQGPATVSHPFVGVIICPNGSINLAGSENGHPFTHRGAFLGSNVTLFEDGTVVHYRDSYSFRQFGPQNGISFIHDRVAVTGGSIRKPGAELTDEFEQSESVAAIGQAPGTSIVTVVYNDKTMASVNPTIEFPDGRSGSRLRIHKGVSILGWSTSVDGGYTFVYGGHILPPAGWSTIWTDPAVANTSPSDPYVFLSSTSGTAAGFEATRKPDPTDPDNRNKTVSAYDPVTQTVDARPTLDSHCIARSTDRGLSFPAVACVEHGNSDGTALAAAIDAAGHRQVFLSTETNPLHVWRMDGETMAITKIQPDPFAVFIDNVGQLGREHVRMRVYGGRLYVVDFRILQTLGTVVGNSIDISDPSATWSGEQTLATNVVSRGMKINTFSFDLGLDGNGQSVLRVLYVKQDGSFGDALATRECALDLTGCHDMGWSTAGQAGNEGGPGLRYGGRWMAAWLSDAGGGLTAVAGWLQNGAGSPFPQMNLTTAIPTCGSDFAGDDYNEIETFGDGRIFVPYTVAGPGCRFGGTFESDRHVGGSIAGFF